MSIKKIQKKNGKKNVRMGFFIKVGCLDLTQQHLTFFLLVFILLK